MTSLIRRDQIESQDWQLKVGAIGEVVEGLDDVDQCIRIILTTPQGSLPLRPDFGCELWRYLDAPAQEARPHILRAVIEAIARWEPRVKVSAVDIVELEPGHLTLTITRALRGDEVDSSTSLIVEVGS